MSPRGVVLPVPVVALIPVLGVVLVLGPVVVLVAAVIAVVIHPRRRRAIALVIPLASGTVLTAREATAWTGEPATGHAAGAMALAEAAPREGTDGLAVVVEGAGPEPADQATGEQGAGHADGGALSGDGADRVGRRRLSRLGRGLGDGRVVDGLGGEGRFGRVVSVAHPKSIDAPGESLCKEC